MDAPYRHPPLPAAVPELRIEAMSPSRLFFSFTGRIDRATYWRVGVVGLLVVGLTLVALLRIAGLSAERAEGVVNLLLSWPAIAISVKRWHDRDRSGWCRPSVPVAGAWPFVSRHRPRRSLRRRRQE